MNRLKNTVLIAALLGLNVAMTAPAAPAATSPAQIPAQPLIQALNTFAAQTGLQLMYVSEIAEGRQSKGAPGGLSAADTLKKLLEGTNLTYEFLNDKTVAIRADRQGKSGDAGAGTGPAEMMRMADAAMSAPDAARAAPDGGDPDGTKNQVTVEGQRDVRRPDFAANADIPRTIDDAQAYYVFDAETIDRSGASNIEDFLKQRLTMNAVAQTNGQASGLSTLGNTSSIDLRGVGADKTLILVNGRRMAGVNRENNEYQPDLNGISLSAIERIEVLPSSASGIYGGSAIGGVVNVILKRNYAGGELRMNYDDTVDGDSPARNISASYGLPLENGRSHLTIDAAWSDREPLLLRDRAWIFRENLADIQSRVPGFIYSSANPWLGSLPNIAPSSAIATTLTLKAIYGGATLNSRNTHVPANTAPGIPTAQLAGLLLANAGRWNLDFPMSTQSPTGLLRPFGQTPQTRSLRAGLRRQALPWLALTADLSWSENRTDSDYHPVTSVLGVLTTTSLTVPAAAPTNPFTAEVRVQAPDLSRIPLLTRSQSRRATLGAIARFPAGWTGALDYTWSESRYDFLYHGVDAAARSAALLSGELNPFVDTLQYPLDYQQYVYTSTYQGANQLHDLALRGSGSLPALPWGQPGLTFGLERRIAETPERTFDEAYPITVVNNRITKYFERKSRTDSVYLEALVPLVRANGMRALRSLELQLSGRGERFQVDTGTPSMATQYNLSPPRVTYGTPNLNGREPVFSEASYTSNNYTVGVKYQPMEALTLRVSRATAFLPPTPAQLIKNPLQSTSTTSIEDPVTGQRNVPVYTLSGGNPDLRPQNSRSFNAGIIWTPTWERLSGLRLNAEFYRIEQFDAIGSLTAQAIADQQALYPERITRDETGTIVLIDISMINLYRRETEGCDLTVDWEAATPAGRLKLHAAESIILRLKNQYSQTQPAFDAVNFPSEGGAVKYKTNAFLSWETGPLMVGWSMRYFGAYRQYGAAGGPSATQRAATGLSPSTTYTLQQGGADIPSQVYHDLLVGYSFGQSSGAGRRAAGWLFDKVSLQLGVRNVFDKVAPLDVWYSGNYYMSPYGDVRLRSYWLSAKLGFN